MERIKIDVRKRKALEKALSDGRGSMARIAAATGISKSQLSKYKSGSTQSIDIRDWEALLPYVEEFISPDVKELVEKSQNRLTAPLVEIFEQLDPEKARAVFDEADWLLREQKTNYFIRLSEQEEEQLRKVGIFFEYDSFGLMITCKLASLCWLFNSIAYAKERKSYLTPLLLRKLLNLSLDKKQARQLFAKIFLVEAYSKTDVYVQHSFYLKGSPPRYYVAELENKTLSHPNCFSVPPNSSMPFRVHDDTQVFIAFSKEEIETMKRGETLVFNFPDLEESTE